MDPEPKFQKNTNMNAEKKKKWVQEQLHIRSKIVETDEFKWDVDNIELIAGVDISFSGKFQNAASAGLLIYSISKKKIIYEDYEYIKLTEEYIPGFLAFRELPSTLQLFKRLKDKKPHLWPEAIIVDGNGILHKNYCGYASHLGVILKTPTIGCAKKFFDVDGLHQNEVEQMLNDKLQYHKDNIKIKGKSGKQWCTAILSDQNQNHHVYISIGNMITLQTATNLCLKLCRFEGPEPVRLVDRISRKMIRKMTEQDYNKAKSYEMVYLRQGK